MLKKNKFLLSCYACEPNKGSEPGVGWEWAMAYRRIGEVWVITRSNNRKPIQNWEQKNGNSGINWVYYDCGPTWLWMKHQGLPTLLYYYQWQREILAVAQKLHKKISFDAVHHITFVQHRIPSFLYLLDAPFVYGPLAGSDKTPREFLRIFSPFERLKERSRYLIERIQPWLPFFRKAIQSATVLLAATPANQIFFRRYFGKSSVLKPAMVFAPSEQIIQSIKQQNKLRLVFAGRLLGWKGIYLALQALKKYVKLNQIKPGQKVELHIIGAGPEEVRLHKLADSLGIQPWLRWSQWLAQKDLFDCFQNSDALVFPSLHDSGGMVVIEANSQGCPAIVLNLGGPSLSVKDGFNGFVIKAGCIGQVTSDLAMAFDKIHEIKRSDCILATCAFSRDALANYLCEFYNVMLNIKCSGPVESVL
jgi:glycosyltransferase involved in cell wall biosynthesis